MNWKVININKGLIFCGKIVPKIIVILILGMHPYENLSTIRSYFIVSFLFLSRFCFAQPFKCRTIFPLNLDVVGHSGVAHLYLYFFAISSKVLLICFLMVYDLFWTRDIMFELKKSIGEFCLVALNIDATLKENWLMLSKTTWRV